MHRGKKDDVMFILPWSFAYRKHFNLNKMLKESAVMILKLVGSGHVITSSWRVKQPLALTRTDLGSQSIMVTCTCRHLYFCYIVELSAISSLARGRLEIFQVQQMIDVQLSSLLIPRSIRPRDMIRGVVTSSTVNQWYIRFDTIDVRAANRQ